MPTWTENMLPLHAHFEAKPSWWGRIRNSLGLLRASGFRYYRRAMIRPPFWVSVNGQTCRIESSSDIGSVACYAEVIAEDCYGVLAYARRQSPKLIVDIGANIGMFSKLCSMLFPGALIHAYEPSPSALQWLNRNAEGTNIRVSASAVMGDSSSVVRLDVSGDSTIGRVSNQGAIEVRCTRVADVAGGESIDLLKMDCEGGEWAILQDATLLRRTREFCLEYHLVDGHTFEEMIVLIANGGHRVVEIREARNWLGILRSVREGIG